MSLTGPSWLDESLIERVLRDAESNEFIKLSNLTVEPAVAKGENLLSDLYRARVKFSTDQKGEKVSETSLVVKVAFHGDARAEMINECGFFTTEISMWSISLPKMNEFLHEIGIPSLSARCYHIHCEPPAYFIFEDLKERSFRMAERNIGLDFDHCLIAVRKLALFHASSVALLEKNPEAVTIYRKGLTYRNASGGMTEYFKAAAKNLGAVVAKWPELNPRISEKIIQLADTFFEKAAEDVETRESDFNVLNHGDFKMNNLMFTYDTEGKPNDMMFVDFQMNRYGSPAIDLHFFFGSSPSDNVREHKRDILLREYHTSLSSTMKNLKCNTEAPSFDELEQILKERAFYEVMTAFVVMSFMLVEKENEKTLTDQMQPDGTCDNPGFRSKEFRKTMTRLLPLYDSLGLLDR